MKPHDRIEKRLCGCVAFEGLMGLERDAVFVFSGSLKEPVWVMEAVYRTDYFSAG